MPDELFRTLSLLLAAAVTARLLAILLHIPEMLLLLALGVLLGPSVAGVVEVPLDSLGPQLLFTLGVSLILFYGGLGLSLPVLRRVAVSLGALALPGTILTAIITGAAAHLVFGLPWEVGFLIGAVLSPTDPAILIPLFADSGLRPKIAQTVIAESACNDPTGAALTLAVSGLMLSGDGSFAGPLGDFALDLVISTLIGLAAGIVLAAALCSGRTGIMRESPPVAVLAIVTISYLSLDSAGGSGYLGAFLAGVIVGNMDHLGLEMHEHHERDLQAFARNAADMVTLFVFLVLGTNIPLAALGENLLPALAVLAVLMLVARPVTVLVCTSFDRRAAWTWRELAFLAWTRETGVVPAALVGVLAGLGIPHGDVLASLVGLAIAVTLLAQALPATWLARRLRLLDAPLSTAAGDGPGTPRRIAEARSA